MSMAHCGIDDDECCMVAPLGGADLHDRSTCQLAETVEKAW